MRWFNRLKGGIAKAGNSVTKSIFGGKLSAATLGELEEQLIRADMGLDTVEEIMRRLKRERVDLGDAVDADVVRQLVAAVIVPILRCNSVVWEAKNCPHIMMFCGVNGSGKTTTVGKMAILLRDAGKKVLLVACDTFRAAAVEQLQVWSERSGAGFFCGAHDADPASVAFSALQKAQSEGYDVVMIDTAGRLQNKQNLMDELGKINRVINKVMPDAPHDTILVIDATNGQNVINQVEVFSQIVNITGMAITKLDSTARGGVIVRLSQKFSIPVLFAGVGEGDRDLVPFDIDAFVKALLA
jgi:fused signal recognition particle receptor